MKKFTTRCKENGIVFYSKLFPDTAYDTFYDDKGNILTMLSHTEKLSKEKKEIPLYIFLIDIALISLAVMSGVSRLVSASFIFAFFVSFKLNKIVKTKCSAASKFHAAKHMVINTYESLEYERIPSMNEVKKASRFYRNCSDKNILSDFLLYSLICLAVAMSAHKTILYLLLCITILIFIILAHKKNWLQFLQMLVTCKPSDKELKLVIEALRNYEEIENRIKPIDDSCNITIIIHEVQEDSEE